MNITKRTIDAALKKEGINAEIFKGKGYFYFAGSSVDFSHEQGVYGVARFSDLTIDRWVDECKQIVKA